jgi:CMP-N-acetylneuraminic acid synthetase
VKPICAIINARLGSSRTKNKMTRPFGGSTLLEIALEKLNRLDFFDRRFLAVAEEELKALARNCKNVEILERSPEAVAPGPHPPLVTFEHYLRTPTRYIFVLNACAAFLSLATLRKAFDFFQATDHPSYMAAVPTREWIFDAAGRPLTHKDPSALQNTSHGAVFYRAAHSFYIIDRERFARTEGTLWLLQPGDPCLVEIPPGEAHDVDTEEQFEFASYWYKKISGPGKTPGLGL